MVYCIMCLKMCETKIMSGNKINVNQHIRNINKNNKILIKYITQNTEVLKV